MSWSELTEGRHAESKGHQWKIANPGNKTVIMWRRRKGILLPGTSWWRRTFSPPLDPVYQGPQHSEVVIRRVEPAAPAVELPADFETVFREELKQGFLKAGYHIPTDESAKHSAGSEQMPTDENRTDKHFIVDVDVLEYANPGFLAASLQPFTTEAVLRVGLSFFDEGAARPFALLVAKRSASRYGLMSVVLHVASSITGSMAAMLRGVCIDVPQQCKKEGI